MSGEAESALVLPSARAAADLVAGRPGSLAEVAGTVAMRSALVAVGLALAGERRELLKKSVFAALAIEAFVLGYAYVKRP